MKVHVTPGDITHGTSWDGYRCPIARAVLRATGMQAAFASSIYIAVYDHHLCPKCPGNAVQIRHYRHHAIKWWETPPEAAKRIINYDRNEWMIPFIFEL